MNIRPPNVKSEWDDNDIWTQALLISYHQIRELEESKLHELYLKAASARIF